MHLLTLIPQIILLLSETLHAIAVSDVYGRNFLIAFPDYLNSRRKIYLLLYTISHENIQIQLINHWSLDVTPTVILLSRKKPKIHQILTEEINPLTKISTPNVHQLASPYLFRLSVFTVYSEDSLESLQAVPVEGWGRRYFAVTLRNSPFVIIVTHEANSAMVTILASDKARVDMYETTSPREEVYGVYLGQNSVYRLQLCDRKYSITGTLIEGTSPLGVISGNCAGYSDLPSCQNISSGAKQPAGFVMEMLLPYETFGQDFITLYISRRRGDGYLSVMASEPSTTVFEHKESGNKAEHSLATAGEKLLIETDPYPRLLTSNKPIQVIYVKHLLCNHTGWLIDSDPAITLVVPTTLFMNAYHWSTPGTDIAVLQHFAVYVCLKYDFAFSGLYLDGKSISNHNTSKMDVRGLVDWLVGETELTEGSHDLFTNKSGKVGLYLYGISERYTYIHPAGFISAQLNPRNCQEMMKKGDKIDNDCDGRIDEEARDDIDNDKDGRTDEDLAYPPPKNGGWGEWNLWYCEVCDVNLTVRSRYCDNPSPVYTGYYCDGADKESGAGDCKLICKEMPPTTTTTVSTTLLSLLELSDAEVHITLNTTKSQQATNSAAHKTEASSMYWSSNNTKNISSWGDWSEWECTSNCSDLRVMRIRHCVYASTKVKDKCDGSSVQFKDANCKRKCPEDCQAGKWGINCESSCENCDPDCNKHNGSCESCKPGFHYPHLSCSKACGHFTYGVMCKGDCVLKCSGLDCLERKIGACPGVKMIPSPFWLFLLLVPIILLLYLWTRKGSAANVDDDKMFDTRKKSGVSLMSSHLSLGSKARVEDTSQASSRAGVSGPYKKKKPCMKYSLEKLASKSNESLYDYDEIYGTLV